MSTIAAVEDLASDTYNANDFRDDDAEEKEDEMFTTGEQFIVDLNKMHDASWDHSASSEYTMDPEDILRRAGVDPSEGYMPQMSFRESRMHQQRGITVQKKMAILPNKEEIQSMYGSKPYILGLERCEDYRNAIPQINRLMGPAGLFNSVGAEFDLELVNSCTTM